LAGTLSPSLSGGYSFRNASGRSIGFCSPSLGGGANYYGASGRYLGSSSSNIGGGYTYRTSYSKPKEQLSVPFIDGCFDKTKKNGRK
jgi:hypothetical protein